MKIEKETFRGCAGAVNVIAKEVSFATVISGIAMAGAAMATYPFGIKHPILGNICVALSAGIVSTMVMGNERLQDAIYDSVQEETDKLTDFIYGSDRVNIDKIIED